MFPFQVGPSPLSSSERGIYGRNYEAFVEEEK